MKQGLNGSQSYISTNERPKLEYFHDLRIEMFIPYYERKWK